MKTLLPATLAIVSLIGTAFALTEADLTPAALTGKTLTFTVETGASPLATSGTWSGSFGASPGNVFTKTRVTGDSTNTTGTWAYNSTFSGMYEYTLTGFLTGQPKGILTLWISGGTGRYEVFLEGVFGNSQTGGFTIGSTAVKAPEIGVTDPSGKLTDGTAKSKFGTVRIGRSTSKIFTVRNSGSGKLTGLAVSKSGTNKSEFKVYAIEKTSLTKGGSTTFKVVFKPVSKGVKKAIIHIDSNDADESPFDITLTGAAVN